MLYKTLELYVPYMFILHSAPSSAFPSQFRPPLAGLGEEQLRFRVLLPRPQVTEHSESSPHSPQEPSTVRVSKEDFSFLVKH